MLGVGAGEMVASTSGGAGKPLAWEQREVAESCEGSREVGKGG